MLNYSDARLQVQKLQKIYPRLKITESTPTKLLLQGPIEIYRSACNFILQKEYLIEITIPIGSNKLPSIKDVDNSIDKSYPHRYLDGRLCLETDTSICIRFIDGMDLIAWMEEFVEPYFFSYEFFTRFGFFPFGDREHDINGILSTYQDFFNEADINTTKKLIYFAVTSNYRGHFPCPCKSGKRLRSCHGKYLFPFMTDERKKAIIKSDLAYIMKGAKYF